MQLMKRIISTFIEVRDASLKAHQGSRICRNRRVSQNPCIIAIICDEVMLEDLDLHFETIPRLDSRDLGADAFPQARELASTSRLCAPPEGWPWKSREFAVNFGAPFQVAHNMANAVPFCAFVLFNFNLLSGRSPSHGPMT